MCSGRLWNDVFPKYTNGCSITDWLSTRPSLTRSNFLLVEGAHARMVSQRSRYPELKSNRQQPPRASESYWINICRSQQVDGVRKSCYFHIRALRHVRDSLPDDVAQTVAVNIVTSRMDYIPGTATLCMQECHQPTAVGTEHSRQSCTQATKIGPYNSVTS